MLQFSRTPLPSHSDDSALERKAAFARARKRLIEITREHYARSTGHVDGLTGPNDRSAVRDALRNAVRRRGFLPRELMVACIDLDGLEPVNDAHGRHVVDELRKVVASRLSRLVQGRASSAGRDGDHRFACVLQGPGTLGRATQTVARMLDTLSAPCEIGSLRLRVRPSIGVSRFPHDGTTAEHLLMHAEAAMRRARHYRMGYAFYTGVLDCAFGSPAGDDPDAGTAIGAR